MTKKSISWKTKGMNRDISVSAFNAEFAFENRNIRLSTNEGNTMMSWVNERGTKKMSLHIDTTPWSEEHIYVDNIAGTPIGTAVVDHKLIVFTAEDDGMGNIYLFEASTDSDYDYTGKLLAHDNYDFMLSIPWKHWYLMSQRTYKRYIGLTTTTS